MHLLFQKTLHSRAKLCHWPPSITEMESISEKPLTPGKMGPLLHTVWVIHLLLWRDDKCESSLYSPEEIPDNPETILTLNVVLRHLLKTSLFKTSKSYLKKSQGCIADLFCCRIKCVSHIPYFRHLRKNPLTSGRWNKKCELVYEFWHYKILHSCSTLNL